MRQALALLLFAVDDPAGVVARPVSPGQALHPLRESRREIPHTEGSPQERRFIASADCSPTLATLTPNTIQPAGDLPAFDRLTVPTALH